MLKRLDLSSSTDGDWLAKVVALCPLFAGLKFLNLSDSNLTDIGLQALIDSKFLGGLEVLLVPKNKIKRLPATVESPDSACLAGLKLLDIRFNASKNVSAYIPSPAS